MSSSTNNTGRRTGRVQVRRPASQPTGAPAPVAPPAPPAQPNVNPNPAPAQTGTPFQQEPQRNPWKFFGILVIIVAIGFVIFAGVKWGIPALRGSGDSNPSGQVGGQTGGQGFGSGNSGNNSGSSDQPTDGNSGDSSASVAEQAVAIDPWYSGIPDSSWLSRTAAELGGNNGLPLGAFAKHFGVVLNDGTVIVRANSENGSKTPITVSGYSVPPEWRNKALVLDKADNGMVLVLDQIPADLSQPQVVSGEVWTWDYDLNTYVWYSTGSADTGSFG